MHSRPRLAEHVAVRRHQVDGEDRVVLTDADTRGEVVMGAREWDILRCADGTRDLAGVVLAARSLGRHTSVDQLRSFLGQIHAAGLLSDGPAMAPAASTQPVTGVDKGLLMLPNAGVRCDGAGSCCRLYPTTIFSRTEAARARAALPSVREAGDDEARVFTPRRGAQLTPWQPRAVTMRNGRCGYLADDGGCRLHAHAGPATKPAGCQLFPLTFVDDGATVRVSAAPECSCVYRSAREQVSLSHPILAAPAIRTRHLPAAAWIEPCIVQVCISAKQTVRHGDYADFRNRVLARLEAVEDVAQWLWAMATHLCHEPVDMMAADSCLPAGSALPASERQQAVGGLCSLASAIDEVGRRQQRWRSSTDLARLTMQWLATASERSELPAATPDDHFDEQLYLRHTAFGDLWLREPAPPLATSLRQAALRMWLARHARMTPPPGLLGDVVWNYPLALCEAVGRAHGLHAPLDA